MKIKWKSLANFEDILYEYRDSILRATVELDIQNKQK